jgi:hypothetical protein
MNSNVFKAIVTLFQTTNSFNTATNGRLEYGRAQDIWTDNFATVQGLTADPSDCFRQAKDDVSFQVNVFSSTRAGCWDLLSKCVALFDKTELTITGHYPAMIRRQNQVLPIWNEGDNLYQATAEFNIRVQAT